MKKTTDRKEFYEGKTWYVLFAIFFIFLITIVSLVYGKADDFDRSSILLPFCGAWIGFILYMYSLLMMLSQKGPYIIVDKLRIQYKEKSMVRLWMNTGKNQTFLWNEIKSVTLAYPYINLGFIKFPVAVRSGWKCQKAIKLNIKNGQGKWIYIHTLPKYERQLLLKAIQKYKEVQTDDHWPLFG